MGFINIHSVAKYQKTRRGALWGHLKNFRKSRTVPKKIQRGDPLVPTLKSIKPKGGPFGIT